MHPLNLKKNIEIFPFSGKLTLMKSAGWLVLILVLGSPPLGQAVNNPPTPVDWSDLSQSPYLFTGLVRTPSGHGSGSVAVQPNLVLGCAHVYYTDANTWRPAGSIEWFWRWNQGEYPSANQGLYLTGYYYFTSYQASAIKNGRANARTFAEDFVANYSVSFFTAGGYAAGWVEDGKKYLTTGGRSKIITGYPSGRYRWYPSHPDEHRMHAVSFNANMKAATDTYLQLSGVEAGKGNSGGPVWVWDGTGWALAGVFVSGLSFPDSIFSSIGVCCLNKKWWTLILAALGQTSGSAQLFKKTANLSEIPAAISDQSATTRTFQISGMVGVIEGMKLDLSVNHQRQGDLMVTLRSPSGKTVTLLSAVAKNKSSPADLDWSGRLVSGFSGQAANGTWTLTMKDTYRGHTGSVLGGSLEIVTH